MKKLLLFPTFLFFALSSFSQSQKNDLKLTVSALPLLGSSENFESGINGFVFKPAIGYNITDKTSIELNFTYATLNNLKVGFVDSYYNSYAFVPTLRNNFINKSKLRIFAEIGLGLGSIKYEANNENFKTIEHQNLGGGIFVMNLGLGANYFFTDNFGLEFVIPYINTKNITSDNTNVIYSGIGPTIGFTYKIN